MSIRQNIRIGTRDSNLAMWQARQVQQALQEKGISATLVPIKSEGDINLVTPLYEMGVEGIFTRALDAHLLSHKIDIAVHSMKDVPIKLAAGIVQAAVLQRGSHKDVLLARNEAVLEQLQNEELSEATIATSSIRRKAQWLSRYPAHRIENLRGNVQTRLQKLRDSKWDGAIFAAAGLERIGIDYPYKIDLDWMLPAPAQGAIMVVCRQDEQPILKQCASLNNRETQLCVQAERDFLAALLGGCATPIGAWAYIAQQTLHFNGILLSPDGKEAIKHAATFTLDNAPNAGETAATAILNKGGEKIIRTFKK